MIKFLKKMLQGSHNIDEEDPLYEGDVDFRKLNDSELAKIIDKVVLYYQPSKLPVISDCKNNEYWIRTVFLWYINGGYSRQSV